MFPPHFNWQLQNHCVSRKKYKSWKNTSFVQTIHQGSSKQNLSWGQPLAENGIHSRGTGSSPRNLSILDILILKIQFLNIVDTQWPTVMLTSWLINRNPRLYSSWSNLSSHLNLERVQIKNYMVIMLYVNIGRCVAVTFVLHVKKHLCPSCKKPLSVV